MRKTPPCNHVKMLGSFGNIKSKFSQIPAIFLVLNNSHQEENKALKTSRWVLCHNAMPKLLPVSVELDESTHYLKDVLDTFWRCSHNHYPNRSSHTNLWLIPSVKTWKHCCKWPLIMGIWRESQNTPAGSRPRSGCKTLATPKVPQNFSYMFIFLEPTCK